jgi:hypothetical protein
VGVCGNHPPECEDVDLASKDVELVGVDPENLLERISLALGIARKVEAVAGLHRAYRLGTYVPIPKIKYPVYFLSRAADREYVEATSALRSHAKEESQHIAIVVPTVTFVGDALRREMAMKGIPLLPLTDLVALDDVGLHLAATPAATSLLDAIGSPSTLSGASPAVATAFIKERGGTAAWHELREHELQALVAAAGNYGVFANELTSSVTQAGDEVLNVRKVPGSYFTLIREAAEARTNFDPGMKRDHPESAKQIFQRARAAFSPGKGGAGAIFKTVRLPSRTTYRLDPDDSVSFAFAFAPKP